jgi:hypothetical protein
MMQPLHCRDILCSVSAQEGSRKRELPIQIKTDVKTDALRTGHRVTDLGETACLPNN